MKLRFDFSVFLNVQNAFFDLDNPVDDDFGKIADAIKFAACFLYLIKLST